MSMLLPKEIITSKNLVTETIDASQFQPCGVDLTLKEVLAFRSAGKIDFDNSERRLSEAEPVSFVNDEVRLKPGAYKVRYNEYVSIPDDCAALAYPRSSLLRCGAFLHCALWDPGYHGRSESLLVVSNEHGITLKKNAKLVQLVFIRLEHPTKHLYRGLYQGENR